ncbi:MAG: hypothetical protein B7Z44_00415 [Caulobacter sp. 12-67-6]|nr:MAG: hypothetical protein B7Z44_00415 [Caulobacter sp. 12-67-6]
MPKEVTVVLALTPAEAAGLSQFVKRADHGTARRHAADKQESDAIYDSWIAIRSALAEAGYAPR